MKNGKRPRSGPIFKARWKRNRIPGKLPPGRDTGKSGPSRRLSSSEPDCCFCHGWKKAGKLQRKNLVAESLLELKKTHVWLYLLIFSGFWFMFNALFDVLPNLTVVVTIVAMNLVADQLRDVLNPRLQTQ